MTTTHLTLEPAQLTVNGEEYEPTGTFTVLNPTTGEALAEAPAIDASALDDVFRVADRAFVLWRADEDARRDALRRAADVIEAEIEELSRVLTLEQGKPLADSRVEFFGAAAWLRYYADLDMAPEIVRDDHERYEAVVRRPLGVVVAITPWNFPILLAMWKIAPALRAGNTVVVKPSPFTPLSTLALGCVLRGVLPDGVLNVVAGPDPLGAALVTHPAPRKISFTGSTATGKRVAAAVAADLKRVTLELGGNDPAIILDDVDVAGIAERLFWGAFGNNGQICLAVKRVYAHRSVHAELVAALADIASSVRVGDGLKDGTQLGPINNTPQLDRVTDLVSDALRQGARAAAGGTRIDGQGLFFAPTILDRVSDGMRVVDEEQFGPVLPVLAFDDIDEAVARANNSPYGLTSSIWSGDVGRAFDLASRMESGQVSINSHASGVQAHLPFGGYKWSGVGVENGPWGLHSFTELQTIAGPGR